MRAYTKYAFTRRVASDEFGTAALEFAIIAAPFFALLVAVLQTAVVYFALEGLQTAAEQSARLIVTGQAQNAGLSKSAFKNRVCAILPPFLSCSRLLIDVKTAPTFSAIDTSKPTITYDSNGNVSSGTAYNIGGSGSIIIVRLIYLWPVISGPLGAGFSKNGNGDHILIATDVAKNEPYAQGAT